MLNEYLNSPVMATVLLLAGAGIPVMAALNAGLGSRLGHPVPAAFVLFAFALAMTTLLAFFNPLPAKSDLFSTPVYFYLGGAFIVFYVIAITLIAPKFGLGNSIFFVLLGQIFAATLIDHLGLLGLPQVPVAYRRVIGLVFVAMGVFLFKKPVAVL